MRMWMAISVIRPAGKLPIRRTYTGDVPVDGSSGNFEWDGYIPFDELPQAYNPPGGFVVTANQNPFPPDYPYRVSGTFGAPYRSRQILDMLRAGGNKLKPEDSLRIQKDVYSGFNKFLARQLAAAYADRKGTNKVFDSAIAMLATWDGQMDAERPEPLITNLTYQYLRKAIAERASPGNGELYELQIATAVVERILREHPAGWFGNYNELLLRCFADGMEEGQRMQGADPSRWKWGRNMFLNVDQSGGRPGAGGGEIFRYRASAHERRRNHGQADHDEAGAFRADECLDGRLGRLADESADRRIGPHRFLPLLGRVESLLQRQEFSHAIRKGGCEEHGHVCAEKKSRDPQAPASPQLWTNQEKLLLVFLGLLRFFLLVHAFGHRLYLPSIRLALFSVL